MTSFVLIDLIEGHPPKSHAPGCPTLNDLNHALPPAPLKSGGERTRHRVHLGHPAPSLDAAKPDHPRREQPVEKTQDSLVAGKRGLCLDSPTKLPVHPLDHVRRPQRLPLLLREPIEGQQLRPGLLEAPCHRLASLPPTIPEPFV